MCVWVEYFKPLSDSLCEILNIQSVKRNLWLQVNNFSPDPHSSLTPSLAYFLVPVDQERQNSSQCLFCHRLSEALVAFTWLLFKSLSNFKAATAEKIEM